MERYAGLFDGAPDVRVLRYSSAIARKPFVCEYCKEEKPTGSRCFLVVGLEEGAFFQTRYCSPAAECLERISDEEWHQIQAQANLEEYEREERL